MKKIIWLSLITICATLPAMHKEDNTYKKMLEQIKYIVDTQSVPQEVLVGFCKFAYYAGDVDSFGRILKKINDNALSHIYQTTDYERHVPLNFDAFTYEGRRFHIEPQRMSPGKSSQFARLVLQRMNQSLKIFSRNNPPKK